MLRRHGTTSIPSPPSTSHATRVQFLPQGTVDELPSKRRSVAIRALANPGMLSSAWQSTLYSILFEIFPHFLAAGCH
eukprot:scaffold1340_cov233-Amphora_coffeaeformis.AAC.6